LNKNLTVAFRVSTEINVAVIKPGISNWKRRFGQGWTKVFAETQRTVVFGLVKNNGRGETSKKKQESS
jgi:hypothetical protein